MKHEELISSSSPYMIPESCFLVPQASEQQNIVTHDHKQETQAVVQTISGAIKAFAK